MLDPGAAISGCKAERQENNSSAHMTESNQIMYLGGTGFALRIFLEMEAGPLDEKYATVGAGLYCDTTVVGRIVATGFLGSYKICQN